MQASKMERSFFKCGRICNGEKEGMPQGKALSYFRQDTLAVRSEGFMRLLNSRENLQVRPNLVIAKDGLKL